MGDLHQCPECGGTGVIYTDDPMGLGRDDRNDCQNCDGTGWLDEHGEPFYMEPELPAETPRVNPTGATQ